MNHYLTRALSNGYTANSLGNICVKHMPVPSRVWARGDFLFANYSQALTWGRG